MCTLPVPVCLLEILFLSRHEKYLCEPPEHLPARSRVCMSLHMANGGTPLSTLPRLLLVRARVWRLGVHARRRSAACLPSAARGPLHPAARPLPAQRRVARMLSADGRPLTAFSLRAVGSMNMAPRSPGTLTQVRVWSALCSTRVRRGRRGVWAALLSRIQSKRGRRCSAGS